MIRCTTALRALAPIFTVLCLGAATQPELWWLRPIEWPAEPGIRREAWVRNPVDRFVLARLEREGIEPANEADQAALLRRHWRRDKGPAQLDVRHRFVADFVQHFPFDRWLNAKGIGRHLVGGWQVSGILLAQPGPAITVTQSGPRPAQRPDYIGGEVYTSSGGLTYLNRAAFALVPVSPASAQPLRVGSVGRGSIRGPGQWTVNFGLGKNRYFFERVSFQVRAEMFNALNHVNPTLTSVINAPVADLVNPNFGRITGSAQERRMQIVGRLSF